MEIEVGRVAAIYRYAVKSMAGEGLDAGELGWHGLEGDRRFAFRRLAEEGGFPWLTAGRVPDMIRYVPVVRDGVPTHVRMPDGRELEVAGDELRDELSRLHKSEVALMRLNHGMFDDAAISVIATRTIEEIARRAERAPDVRRFRPNVVVETSGEPFAEDAWIGGVLAFGDPAAGAAVGVTQRDVRCSMVNLDPDTAEVDAAVLKAVVRSNENCAGVYGSVVRTGAVEVGQAVFLLKRS
jgi:uncharacterized protein